MQRNPGSLRAVLAFAAAAAGWLTPTPAAAGGLNQHYLSAQVGQSTASISDVTFDEEESSVDASYQNGVPGTDENARALFASVNSASGVLLTSGVTTDLTVANMGRAVAQLEQRMFLEGDGAAVVEAQLLLSGSASGDYIEVDASLQLGSCIVGVRKYSTGMDPSVSDSGCTDTGAVTWNVSGGGGALHITANYASEPSAVDIGATVSGDFGGSVSDVANGQFNSGGTLSIDVQGSTATFASASFLTVPEPGGPLLSAVGALALCIRARSRTRTDG